MANQSFLIGNFFFKKTQNGNLTGEFTNNQSSIISTESGDRTDQSDINYFFGNFNVTWQQDGESFFRKLSIEPISNVLHNKYKLSWLDTNDLLTFYGEGFLVDSILIGHYTINNTQ